MDQGQGDEYDICKVAREGKYRKQTSLGIFFITLKDSPKRSRLGRRKGKRKSICEQRGIVRACLASPPTEKSAGVTRPYHHVEAQAHVRENCDKINVKG